MADQRLLSIVERIVRLEEEKRDASDCIKEVVLEAKSAGYDAKAVRQIVRRRMEDATQREKREATEQALDLMLAELGDFVTSPLGQAAVSKAA